MTTTGLIVIMLVPAVAIIGVAFALRGRVQRRLYAATGLPEWNEEARRLSWSDRMHLFWVNSRGRAARPDLAATAARRGRAMLAAVDSRTGTTFMRWLLRLGLLLAVLQLGFNVWVLTGDDTSWLNWATLVLWTVAIILFLVSWRQQRRDKVNLQRSIELNDALAAQHSDEQPDFTVPAT